MPAVGGSIQAVSLRGRLLPVAADADGTRDIGGFANEVQSNGDGSARIVKTRKPWIIGGLTLEVDDDRADQEFLQEIADSNDYVSITIELVSGTVYMGEGTITDNIEFSTQNSTAGVTLSGPRNLEQQ